MSNFQRFSFVLGLVAALNLSAVRPLIAADNLELAGEQTGTTYVRPIADLELGADGQLQGRVSDATGASAGQAQVVVYRAGQPVGQTVADANGQFTFPNLASGVYHIECRTTANELGQADYRLWNRGTAPPAAVDSALLRTRQMVVRGQHYPSGAWCFLTKPWVTAAILTAAIAVPIAVSNDDDSAS